MSNTIFRRQRLSKIYPLTFNNDSPFNSVICYEPAGKVCRVSVYPSLTADSFPDVENVELKMQDGKKAPAALIGNGHAAWLEVQNVRRAFFVLGANGNFLEAAEPTNSGSQVVVIQSDISGKVEAVRAFPADAAEPLTFIHRAANLYLFEKFAKPITQGETKIMVVDAKRLKHEFVATLSAPGIKFQHIDNVSTIRQAGFETDGFRYWKKAHVWPIGTGTAVIGQNVFGSFHVASFDSTGAQTATQKTADFHTALMLAQNQLGV